MKIILKFKNLRVFFQLLKLKKFNPFIKTVHSFTSHTQKYDSGILAKFYLAHSFFGNEVQPQRSLNVTLMFLFYG